MDNIYHWNFEFPSAKPQEPGYFFTEFVSVFDQPCIQCVWGRKLRRQLHLKRNHRITNWLGLEGTYGDHAVQPTY